MPGCCVRRKHGPKDWLRLYTVSGFGCFGEEGKKVVLEEFDVTLVWPGRRILR